MPFITVPAMELLADAIVHAAWIIGGAICVRQLFENWGKTDD